MVIRLLQDEDYDQAVDLKISCWDEELAGRAPNRRVKTEEYEFITRWVSTATEHSDIRLAYGVFEGPELLGFAAASMANPSDAVNGIEINYLYVKKEHRRRGLALKLLDKLLTEFDGQGIQKVVAYCHHYAPSNTFYRKLSGRVVRQDIQGAPLDQLKVDVFVMDFKNLKRRLAWAIRAKYART